MCEIRHATPNTQRRKNVGEYDIPLYDRIKYLFLGQEWTIREDGEKYTVFKPESEPDDGYCFWVPKKMTALDEEYYLKAIDYLITVKQLLPTKEQLNFLKGTTIIQKSASITEKEFTEIVNSVTPIDEFLHESIQALYKNRNDNKFTVHECCNGIKWCMDGLNQKTTISDTAILEIWIKALIKVYNAKENND